MSSQGTIDSTIQVLHSTSQSADEITRDETYFSHQTDSDDYILLGKNDHAAGEYQAAIEHLNEFLLRAKQSEEPEQYAFAYDLQGQCYEALHQLDAAKRCYQTATRIHSTYAPAWLHLALLFTKNAEDYLTQEFPTHLHLLAHTKTLWVSILSSNLDTKFQIAAIIDYQAMYLEALKLIHTETEHRIDNTYKSAIQYYYQAKACRVKPLTFINSINSNLTNCTAEYGHYLYKNGDYCSAQKYYLQTLKSDPDHLTALNQLGMCLFKENKYPEARAYFSQIIDRTMHSQEQADAWLNIACTYIEQDNWSKAAKTLRDAKRLAPDDALILSKEKEVSSKMIFALCKTQTMFRHTTPKASEPFEINHHMTFEL